MEIHLYYIEQSFKKIITFKITTISLELYVKGWLFSFSTALLTQLKSWAWVEINQQQEQRNGVFCFKNGNIFT